MPSPVQLARLHIILSWNVDTAITILAFGISQFRLIVVKIIQKKSDLEEKSFKWLKWLVIWRGYQNFVTD